MSGALLTLQGLAVAANGVPLLSRIELALAEGERVAVHGPSGCGKTTLLRAICGLDDPTQGTVRLRGQTPAAIGWPAFRRKVTLVQQRPVLVAGSVAANLRRPFTYRSATFPFPAARARELLDRLGVGAERMDQSAESLSVGQQQRVSLVRALLVAPAVLLLDEPTSALDADAVGAVEGLVREEAEREGRAALIVTHSAEQARRWCDRTLDLAPHRAGAGTARG